MQKSISDMAKFIKNIMPPIPETYSIKPMFKDISGEEDIRKGVLVFREFLNQIYDSLVADDSLYNKPSKNRHDCDFHPSLPVSYPFLNNLKCILFNIGYHGKLIENGESMLIDDIKILTSVISAEGRARKTKISNPRLNSVLKFLSSCGLCFDGLNLNGRASDILKTTSLKITYSNNPVMLVGLKVMAIAQRDLYTKGNHDIFLRCDHRVLRNEETESISILKDFVAPLSKDVQDFVVKLHKRYLEWGLTCRVDVFYLSTRLIYSYKRKEIWTLSSSLESGYRIIINAENADLYSDMIESFPVFMQQKISKGFGCNKRLFGEHCQIGCHGFSFSLDNSIMDISNSIEVWLDKEISYLPIKTVK